MMKISELITRLTAIAAAEGDLDVVAAVLDREGIVVDLRVRENADAGTRTLILEAQ